ncbi:histidine kinase [Streptomyces sp. AM 4-1-1]|uniref:sensor histidine kinase n=1 Tax=unclassified Streptomyces TaxID=2593676 RepID=UPI0023B9BD01|nr:histidine kinase [Streptomyces sp. AM 4-1-1]WEH32342.1 histidine kinase [Streptomyces sp. AM 4-1-1]
MLRFLRRLVSPVTYTRWLHLCIPMAFVAIWLFIDMEHVWVLLLLAVPLGLIPAVRLEEGLQAQLLLTPYERGTPYASIGTASAATWEDRWRTVLWLEVRLLLSAVVTGLTSWLPLTSVEMVMRARGDTVPDVTVFNSLDPHWWYIPLAVVPLLVLPVLCVLLGDLITLFARRLLGPSRYERLTALEERTEQLLERNRIARELHDSIGHALTVAVVQAGAARAAGDAAFTERALAAIEETGRDALDDLERVLRVLRESSGTPIGQQPTLVEAGRLLESARGSGVKVDSEVSGQLGAVPGAVSREGYRILQEALTNMLRHSGAAAVGVRIIVADGWLELEVTNPLGASVASPGGGTGLRGIRERAALLGGKATTGPYEGGWRVHVSLPLDGIP